MASGVTFALQKDFSSSRRGVRGTCDDIRWIISENLVDITITPTDPRNVHYLRESYSHPVRRGFLLSFSRWNDSYVRKQSIGVITEPRRSRGNEPQPKGEGERKRTACIRELFAFIRPLSESKNKAKTTRHTKYL
ncbi:hypothetical protein TNIN_26591 [Trichonephila inaurata madagascariensis]|uniref:Uncharacterized protein n=1 Tax=Trichonephila inaurata madagascariensis TaxID=2747483 RepID=A0A8X6XSV9_9ARAC|nr:hypothetical protein TNIN_26591 [Trichonephila inaurata madagascariensis]